MRTLLEARAARPRAVDSRDIWLVLGLAAYWSWSFSLPRAGLAGAPANGAWAVNAACHAATLFLLAFLSLKRSPFRADGRPSAARLAAGSSLMALGAAGTAASGAVGSAALAYVASALSGAAAGVLAIQLIPLLARPARSESRLFYLVGAASVGSVPLSLVVFDLPGAFQAVFLAALPFMSAACAWLAGADAEETAPAQPPSRPASARDAVSAPLMACSFLFAFFASLTTAMGGEGPEGGYRQMCALTFLAVLAALALIAVSGGRRVLIRLVFVFMPVLAGGVLLVPFLVPGHSLLSGTLINVGRDLFSVYLYTSLALISSTRGHAAFATGLVVGVGDIGHVVAALAGPALASVSGASALAACAALLYLTFICAVMLLYPSRANRLLLATAEGASRAPAEEDGAEGAAKPDQQGLLGLAADKAGLSEREREVLPLLLTARTLVGIASELGISYNTAKTHASHIFRKAGVGSRDELAAWVESLANESGGGSEAR